MSPPPLAKTLHNFGRNITFRPVHHERPSSESEVLELLRHQRGRRLRAHGSLHSWSEVAASDDISIDTSRLQTVQIDTTGDTRTATVGAGCRIADLLQELGRQGWTTPSLGLITQQTLAGATSTATHGSGRHCLSHYIRKLRLATFDASGEPVIREVNPGPELNAARCALGSLGVLTAITIEIRRQYFVEEHFRKHASLQEVLAAETEYPLQQFFWVPWSWFFFGQHRRETTAPRSRLAFLYRWFWSLVMDHGLHWLVISLARWLPSACTPLAFRWVLPMFVPRGWKVVDRSDKQLTMEHHLYRHIETEMFVRQSQLEPMLDMARWLLEWSAGEATSAAVAWQTAIIDGGLQEALAQLRGEYRHHYPICIRKVLPDEGLITMSGGGTEPWYAISFISYAWPDKRTGFFRFADLLIRLSGQLFNARPHWGKHGPLPPPEVERLYPQWRAFLTLREQLDPTRAFLPPWMLPFVADGSGAPPGTAE